MRSDDFVKEARRRGQERLDVAHLQALHSRRLLLPLFRVSDTAVTGRAFEVEGPHAMNPRGWVMEAAAAGRLRDPVDEGYTLDWPHERPKDERDRRWWNGFVYSSWQLLEIDAALNDLAWIDGGADHAPRVVTAQTRRWRTLALCALATRHTPSIMGKITYPSGVDHGHTEASRYAIDDADRLALVNYPAHRLRPDAEHLLAVAHSDPLLGWWSLIRHSNGDGWAKISGISAGYLWMRVAAEILLRAHETLSDAGALEPLPAPGPTGFWTPLHDRVDSRASAGRTLDEALATLGLSPQPRVLLLVEGDTEMLHVPRALDLFGLNRPNLVWVQNARSSNVNPGLIARYAVAPRLHPRYEETGQVEARPTALVVAMDPENRWRDETSRAEELRVLQQAVRQEVQAQGGTITQEELDFLVSVHVWGDQKYELANFEDDELARALKQLVVESGADVDAVMRAQIDAELASARANFQDIRVVLGRLRIRASKIRLAEILWPVLLRKIEAQVGEDSPSLPLLRVLNDVRNKVALLSGSGYVLGE